MAYNLLGSERLFRGKAFQVRADQVRRPDGQAMRVEVVEHPGAVTLLPVDAEGRILFVRQYRHSAGEVLLELPAGTLDPGEDPEACAVRECREETGMSPGRITRLGGFFVAPGYSTEFIHLYLAEDLKPAPLTPDEDEDLSVERLTLDRAHDLARSGELRDAKSLAGLALWAIHRA